MMMAQRRDDDFIYIDDLNDIPHFADEDEEADFWATHSLSDRLLEQAEPIEDSILPPPRPSPYRVSVIRHPHAQLLSNQRVVAKSRIQPTVIRIGGHNQAEVVTALAIA